MLSFRFHEPKKWLITHVFKAKKYDDQEIQSCFRNLVWLEQGAMGAFTNILGCLCDFLMTKLV